MSAYLARWVDLGLEVSPDDTKASITRTECERLVKLVAVTAAAGEIPRRIGGEASTEELIVDKQRCKRIGWVAKQLLKDWGGRGGRPGDVAKEAAIVDWKRWWEDHHNWLLARQRYIATWCHKTGADQLWCKKALTKLDNELKWLEYAMRD